jgi:hypothetical protein
MINLLAIGEDANSSRIQLTKEKLLQQSLAGIANFVSVSFLKFFKFDWMYYKH